MNVITDNFDRDVIQRSHEIPVIVDFWAAWCGPCRALGPAIEAEVEKRAGQLELAKLNVDSEPEIAGRYGIQSIPTVVVFRNGEAVTGFVRGAPRHNDRPLLRRTSACRSGRARRSDRPGCAAVNISMGREDWDHRYAGSEQVWTARPNRFLVAEAAELRPGRALDLACGEGRNARLARRAGVAGDGGRLLRSRARKGAPACEGSRGDGGVGGSRPDGLPP